MVKYNNIFDKNKKITKKPTKKYINIPTGKLGIS